MKRPRDLSRSAWLRWTAFALIWVLSCLGGGWLVHDNEAQRRKALELAFAERAQQSAHFVGSYARDVFARERTLADVDFKGTVSAAQLTRSMRASGFEAAVLLASGGRLLDVYPSAPDLIGTDFAGKYPHLDGALAGVPTASDVVLSAVDHVPVVGFAVPFGSGTGRRVFSGAYVISGTPLQSYLENLTRSVPEVIYLVDSHGSVVASAGSVAAASPSSTPLEPALAAAADQPGAKAIGTGDAQRWVVTEQVPGTRWRVVFAARTAALFQPVGILTPVLGWVVLVALALAGLIIIALFERLLSRRSRLAEQQEQSSAMLTSAPDAFVGTDEAGLITKWNPAAEAMFGWAADEVMGKPMATLLLPERLRIPGAVLGITDASLSGGSAPDGPTEVIVLRRDGAEIPVDVSLFSTRLNGRVRWYAFLRDIRPRQVVERRTHILAQIAESAGDAIYSRDLQGRMTSWNASAERLFGWTAEQMLGHDLSHEMVRDGRVQMEQMVAEVIETQAVRHFEAARFNSTGQRIEVGITLAPLVDEGGALVGFSAIARDIGERRRLLEQLRHNEEVYRSAFEDALLGMYLTGRDGRLIRVNQVFADMLGRTSDELVGLPSEDLARPDYREQSSSLRLQALAGEIDGFRDEFCYAGANDTPVWAEISVSLVRDQQGDPAHFVTQVVDVTQRRAALQERDSRDAMLAAVIANSQSLIYVKDLDGRYLLANEPFESAFGVREADLLGSTEDYLHPVVPPAAEAVRETATAGVLHLEEWSDRPDGRHCYESVQFDLHDATGERHAVCGVSLDVTEQRRATEAVTQARDAAVAATAAKSAFLATMSHEIRTPMNAVIGMTGLLLDTELDRRQREFVETVRSSGDALLLVINDILDFSKLEAGQLELERRPFDLTDAVEGTLDLVSGAAAGKGMDLVCHLDDTCPRSVVGDETRLRQVLVNLLSNAVKFTAEGDVLVTVSSEPADSGAHLLTFAVADTGVGIPAERMSRLFRPFSQVDDSTTRVYGGTGLGLAISRRIVRAMGGDLHVTSTVGRGSTFSFSAVFAAPTHVDAETLRPWPPRELAGRRVLIVDDNPTSLRVLARQLTACGVACTPVATPVEALELLTGGEVYDAAVLDMVMPQMDGHKLAAELRRLPSGKDLPLVLMTSLRGRPDDGDVIGVEYLTKPVKSGAICGALARVLAPPGSTSSTLEVAASVEAVESARRMRVLLVEDNTVNQRVAQLMLRKLGHLVDTVGNGQEAVDAVHASPYDVVLMDVQMPVMDGLEATRRIRAEMPTGVQPHIVAMTASALIEDHDACMAAGMDAYLPKPVRVAELRRAVESVGSVDRD